MRAVFIAAIAAATGWAGWPANASDHLDTHTVIADPRADIGDLYAWTSFDGRRLNLAMTLVGHEFSPKLEYAFHVDSGPRVGDTTATMSIACGFASATHVDCRAGDADAARGDASGPKGLEGRNRRFRVFAGLRDDPFFNNVKGSRDAYQVAATALRNGAVVDEAGCPAFDAATSRSILSKWRQTDGGAAQNFLKGWTPASLVISIDLDLVSRGGPMLAVWGTASTSSGQIDRMGRPLTGNALLAPLAAHEVSDALKEEYNVATPRTGARFVAEIQKTLALYDAYDGKCGNQLLADAAARSPERYRALAALLADDRLWVDGRSTLCLQFFSVELAHLAGEHALAIDCGGRTPRQDAVDVYRSLLAGGATKGVDDGVDRDEREHSDSEFPFLASP